MSDMVKCSCCDSFATSRLCSMPSKLGVRVNLFLCADCGAFTPDYGVASNQGNLHVQILCHERQWGEESNEVLDKTAEDLRELVRFYRAKGYILSPEDEPTIVEIGAGRGCLLAALRREGYGSFGCEPAPALVSLSHRCFGFSDEVLRCVTAEDFLKELSLSQKKLDVVFLWHVLEHLEHPMLLLQEISKFLNPGGVIIAQVPLPIKEMLYPEHLFLFSKKTCFFLAENSGLDVSFCDVSPGEQFLSFVLCKPTSCWPKILEPAEDVLSVWVTDLCGAVVSLDAAARDGLTNLQELKALVDQRTAEHDALIDLRQAEHEALMESCMTNYENLLMQRAAEHEAFREELLRANGLAKAIGRFLMGKFRRVISVFTRKIST